MKAKRAVQTDISRVIGQNLKLIRELNNLTQLELGEQLGVSYQQIQKYESGKNRIPMESLIEIRKRFDIPYDYFFEGLESKHIIQKNDYHILGAHMSKLIKKVKDQEEQKKIIKVIDILCS